MRNIWNTVPDLVALVALFGGAVLAVVVFGLLLGGSILATPQATVVTLISLWCVGLGVGWLLGGGE